MEYIIFSLATWRLSSLLANEDGPFDMFIKLRHSMGVSYDATSTPYGTNVVSRAMLCIWCSSLWIALAFSYFFAGFSWELPIYTLAISTGAIITERFING